MRLTTGVMAPSYRNNEIVGGRHAGDRAQAREARSHAVRRGPAMICPSCQRQNPHDANFCLSCGTRLAPSCSSCGIALPSGSQFCHRCGRAVAAGAGPPSHAGSPGSYTPKHLAEKILTSRSALEGERKQVTVLFADLKG